MDRRGFVGVLALMALGGCTSGSDPAPPSGVTTAAPASCAAPLDLPEPETVTTEVDMPWGLAFRSDGTALVTERDTGRLLEVGADGAVREIGVVPGVEHGGEGGLLGIALTAADPAHLWVYHSTAQDNRVVRFAFDGAAISEPTPVLTGLPHAGTHNGGKIAFGPDGMLWVTVGDAQQRERAQDLDYLGGKILRLTPDGEPAPDHPFPQAPLVYSLGHRNPQGLTWDDAGRAWAAELGQNERDELNLLVAGANYGWPLVEGVGPQDPAGLGPGGPARNPLLTWPVAEASPSGIAYWADGLWMAALRGQRLWAIGLSGERPCDPDARWQGEFGRLRAVEAAPDGALWVSTSNGGGADRLLRVPPP